MYFLDLTTSFRIPVAWKWHCHLQNDMRVIDVLSDGFDYKIYVVSTKLELEPTFCA